MLSVCQIHTFNIWGKNYDPLGMLKDRFKSTRPLNVVEYDPLGI